MNKSDSRTSLENRLHSYSIMATEVNRHPLKHLPGFALATGAALSLTGFATADTIVETIISSALTGAYGTVPIDFNGGGGADFRIQKLTYTQIGIAVQGGAASHIYMYSGNYAKALSLNDLISAGQTFKAIARPNQNIVAWTTKGGFNDQGDKFIGVKFDLGGNTHYGWIKVEVTTGAILGNDITVKGYAYETTPDLGIRAGATDQSLPVSLFSFSATTAENSVTLTWATESETDNLGFFLERQNPGDDQWLKIAGFDTDFELRGQGNTSQRTEYVFTDETVTIGQTYRYRLSDMDTKGNITHHEAISIFVDEPAMPRETAIAPVRPNPFNPDTKIRYSLAQDANVTLRVVDIMGRTVHTIVRGASQSAGSYIVWWNGKDAESRPAASGVYMLVLQAGHTVNTQKVMLVR